MKTPMACIAAAVLFASLDARGQDNETLAQEHFEKGAALVKIGELEKAAVELKLSYELDPVPLVLYNIAVCYDELGSFAESARYYKMYLLKTAGKPDKKQDAVKKRLEELKGQLGALQLSVSEDMAAIVIDGQSVGFSPLESLYLDPGSHEISVSKTGFQSAGGVLSIQAGETKTVTISLVKAGENGQGASPGFAEVYSKPDETEAAQKGQKKKEKPVPAGAFYSMVALTGASLLSAVIMGALVVKKDGEVRDMVESPEANDLYEEKTRLARATDAMIVFTSAFAVTALVLGFYTDFRRETKSKLSLAGGSDGSSFLLGLGGTF